MLSLAPISVINNGNSSIRLEYENLLIWLLKCHFIESKIKISRKQKIDKITTKLYTEFRIMALK